MTAGPSAPRSGRQVTQAAEGSALRAGSSLWRPGTVALAPDDFTLVEHTRADGILVLMGNLGHALDAVSWRNWLAESDITALHDVHRHCLRIQYVSPQCAKLYLARPGARLLSPYRAGGTFNKLRRALRQRHDWHCVLELHPSLGPAPTAADDIEDENPFSVLRAEQSCPHATQPVGERRNQAPAPHQPCTSSRARRQRQHRRPSSTQSMLTCISWNAQGLTTQKVDELIDLATTSKVDIITVQESPLGSPTPSGCPGGCSRPTYPSPSSTHRQFTGGREFCLVQETWEGTCHLTLPANAPFKWISKPRRGEQGQHGGVAFLVHTAIAQHVTPLPSADDHEVLWIKVQGPGGQSARPILLASSLHDGCRQECSCH
jgi:hypothetical protein